MNTSESVTAMTFSAALESYINKLKEANDADFMENYPRTFADNNQPWFEYTRGAKWVKVLRCDKAQRSAFCFIDPTNGDIYKAANWNTPAKGVRGNIFNDKLPLTGGALYR